jgi:hypothetical protein
MRDSRRSGRVEDSGTSAGGFSSMVCITAMIEKPMEWNSGDNAMSKRVLYAFLGYGGIGLGAPCR